jgi:hypothetical protein
MRRFTYGALVALSALTLASRSAYGVAMLMLDDGLGNTVTISDGGGGDSNGAAGAITWVGSLGVWSINVSTGVTKPASGSATNPKMDLNTVDMSTAAGTLTIKFTDDGFGPVPNGTKFRDSIGGTTEGTVTAAELYDAENGAFSGVQIASLGPFPGPAFSGSILSSPVAGIAPFSLTQVVTITHTAGGMTSLDYAKDIPEPSAFLLLGSGLVGFGYLRGRRRTSRA